MKPGISLIRYWGGLAAFMFVPAILGFLSTGCSPSLSLQQLKDKLEEIRKSDGVVTQRALYAAIGKPSKQQSVGEDVYLYYSVKEGMAQIVAAGPAWEGKVPTYVPIKEAGPTPERPENLVKWYLDRGGANPFSTKEEKVDIYHARVIVLRAASRKRVEIGW